jgi:phage tail-like protein
VAHYPLPKFHFQVEWGGSTAGFSEVTGLQTDKELTFNRDGGNPVHEKNMTSGLQKYDSITLKRGVFAGDNEILRWLTTDSFDRIGRQDITITLLNEKHEPVLKWRARNAFPAKVTGQGLKADGNEVAVESIEIHHEGLVIEEIYPESA